MEKAQLKDVKLSVCFHKEYKENVVEEARNLCEKISVVSSVHVIHEQVSVRRAHRSSGEIHSANPNHITLTHPRTGDTQISQPGILAVMVAQLD